jgi:ribosomal-protein-alanine N-acetyltransferase
MIKLLEPRFDFCEVLPSYAEAMSIAHCKCFEVPWSTKDFNDLLGLNTVFGFIVYMANDNFEALSTTAENIKGLDCGGFVLYSLASDQCEILTICVLPKWRRKRLAINLMQNVIKRIKHIGVNEIFLEVAENNAAARNLYINQGFRVLGTRRRYYRQKEGRVDALQLSKSIF